MVNRWKFGVVAVLISALVIACEIYLEPGVQLVYEAQSPGGEVPTEGQMADVLTTVQQRIDGFGGGRVRQADENRIRVDLWGVIDLEEAKSLIEKTAHLEFKERTCTDPACLNYADADLGLTGGALENAYPSRNQTGEWTVNIQFDGDGAEIFSDLTRRISLQQDTKRIAIFLDDELLLAPVSLAWIPNGRSVLTGNFSREQARGLSIQLEFGALPLPLTLIEEGTVEPRIGTRQLAFALAVVITILGLAAIVVVVQVSKRKPDAG